MRVSKTKGNALDLILEWFIAHFLVYSGHPPIGGMSLTIMFVKQKNPVKMHDNKSNKHAYLYCCSCTQIEVSW